MSAKLLWAGAVAGLMAGSSAFAQTAEDQKPAAPVTVEARKVPAANDGKTAKKLEGLYEIVASEKEGQKTPKERILGSTVRFTKDFITVTDGQKKDIYAATYTLDESKTPAVITMESTLAPNKGASATGLVMAEGDTVRLIYALPGGNPVPKEFVSKKGQIMITMRKLEQQK